MGQQSNENSRVRAWVLVEADPVQGVSARIRALDEPPTDDQVVIRADVVDGLPDLAYNIVVPVDLEILEGKTEDEVLRHKVGEIKGLQNVKAAVALKVLVHDPKPPHEASGFITPGEAAKPLTRFARPGRQDGSPGFNPWG